MSVASLRDAENSRADGPPGAVYRCRNAAMAVVGMGLIGVSVALTPPAPRPAVNDIDWRSSPLDLDLRGLTGARYRFRCPAGKAQEGLVIGSGPYTDASSICAAGAHAGVIRPEIGGLVTVEIRPGQSRYDGSLRHFVQSSSYRGPWSGSFVIVVPAQAARL
jgi:hypothetical protein